jgi:signal transduction histidine kinase/CheY-like chemotaxis protein
MSLSDFERKRYQEEEGHDVLLHLPVQGRLHAFLTLPTPHFLLLVPCGETPLFSSGGVDFGDGQHHATLSRETWKGVESLTLGGKVRMLNQALDADFASVALVSDRIRWLRKGELERKTGTDTLAGLPRLVLPEEQASALSFFQQAVSGKGRTEMGFAVPGGQITWKIMAFDERTLLLLRRDGAMMEGGKELNKVRYDFLSDMSHSMLTPMNAIIGLTDLAKEERNSPLVSRYLDQISFYGHTLLDEISEVLHYSRPVTFNSERYKLSEFVDAVKGMALPLCAKKEVLFSLKKEQAPESFLVTDKNQCNQIFFQLLTNAIKYTGRGGLVSIEIEPAGNMMRFIVKDTGSGISEDFLKSVFDPFSQEQPLTGSGMGLGLPIAKRIVTAMQGTIQVASTLGKGTAVTVLLPLDLHTQAKISYESVSLKGKRVLLAEDNDLNAIFVKRMLANMGISADVADDGRKAVSVFSSAAPGTYDLILMDIRMPVMDGYEAAGAIRLLPRKDAKKIPIIAVSTNVFPRDVDKSRSTGLNGHVFKPLEPDRLKDVLSQALSPDFGGWCS